MNTHTHTFPEDGANYAHLLLTSDLPETDPVPTLHRPPAGPRAATFIATECPVSWPLSVNGGVKIM